MKKKSSKLLAVMAISIVALFLAANLFLFYLKAKNKNEPPVGTNIPEDYLDNSQDLELSKDINSPDGSKSLSLKGDGMKYTLHLDDSDFEYEDVINAKFATNDIVLFQTVSDDFGIYNYSIKNEQLVKLIDSSDPSFFENIAFIDDDKYFFIEPKTGKYGFGFASGAENQYFGQKIYETGRIDQENIAAFSNPVISLDKDLVFVIRREIGEEAVGMYIEAYKFDGIEFTNPQYSEKLGNDYGSKIEVVVNGDEYGVKGYNLKVKMSEI